MEISTEVSDGRVTLRPQGRFASGNHHDFSSSCVCALKAGEVAELEVDLAQLEHFDSTGLGILLLLKEQADLVHKRMVLRNCDASVRRLLDISRLKEVFEVA